MMNCTGISVTRHREQILHEACRPLIKTLRQLDPVDFVLLFYSSDSIAIREHFSVLVERHFQNDLVSFGLTGDCQFGWDSELKVAVDLELLSSDVFACFRVWMMPNSSHVEINHLAFDTEGASPEANTSTLAELATSVTIEPKNPEAT